MADLRLAARDVVRSAANAHAGNMEKTIKVLRLLALTGLGWSLLLGSQNAQAATPDNSLSPEARAAISRDTPSQEDAPTEAPEHELSANLFRSPSVGLEYRYRFASVHAGLYPTIINEAGGTAFDGTTNFARAGLSLWLLPVPVLGTRRSSFYVDTSFVRELGNEGWGSGAMVETGFRLFVWEGAFVRLGVSALCLPTRAIAGTDDAEKIKVRPNPGLGWAMSL